MKKLKFGMTDVVVKEHRGDVMTVSLGDGVSIRMLEDGTLRLRATNHQLMLKWLTTNPSEDGVSVAAFQLTRKDVEA